MTGGGKTAMRIGDGGTTGEATGRGEAIGTGTGRGTGTGTTDEGETSATGGKLRAKGMDGHVSLAQVLP
jgi:hypothetical protein